MNLSTTYLGLSLRTPIVCSSSPFCKDLKKLREMEQAGASAVVLQSLFEEQIELEGEMLDHMLEDIGNSYAEAVSYFPEMPSFEVSPKTYLDHIRRVKRSLKIPVIASLNGVSAGGWIRYAQEMEWAGADALELNVYHMPTRLEETGQEIEARYIDLVGSIVSNIRIPVTVKLAPYFTSIANVAWRLDQAGVQGLVLFNRFYQPDFDIDSLNVRRTLSLSTSEELRLRLHWVAMLSRRIKADLAITGGVHTAEDVIKGMMAGAQIVMMTSALLKRGISHIAEVEKNVIEWMREHEYVSIDQMRGSMNTLATDPGAFQRSNYVELLSTYTPPAEM